MSDINITIGTEGDINLTLDGISTFQSLTDTPTSYSGNSGKIPQVNTGEDALEYTDGVMGEVVHGATAGTARPFGFSVVMWIGSVEPDNAINNDVWVDTT